MSKPLTREELVLSREQLMTKVDQAAAQVRLLITHSAQYLVRQLYGSGAAGTDLGRCLVPPPYRVPNSMRSGYRHKDVASRLLWLTHCQEELYALHDDLESARYDHAPELASRLGAILAGRLPNHEEWRKARSLDMANRLLDLFDGASLPVPEGHPLAASHIASFLSLTDEQRPAYRHLQEQPHYKTCRCGRTMRVVEAPDRVTICVCGASAAPFQPGPCCESSAK